MLILKQCLNNVVDLKNAGKLQYSYTLQPYNLVPETVDFTSRQKQSMDREKDISWLHILSSFSCLV